MKIREVESSIDDVPKADPRLGNGWLFQQGYLHAYFVRKQNITQVWGGSTAMVL